MEIIYKSIEYSIQFNDEADVASDSVSPENRQFLTRETKLEEPRLH